MRVAAAIFFLMLGVIVGVVQLTQSHFWSAVSAGALSILVPLLILLGSDAKSSFWVAGLSVLASTSGIFAIFSEHRAMDIDLNASRTEAALALSQPDSTCAGVDDLFSRAARACFIQSNLDQMDAVNEFAKAAYLPPHLGLADQAKSSFSGVRVDSCFELFKQAYAACPVAFASMPDSSRSALLNEQAP